MTRNWNKLNKNKHISVKTYYIDIILQRQNGGEKILLASLLTFEYEEKCRTRKNYKRDVTRATR